MIRINLLAVERDRAKRPRAAISSAQRVTIGASLIILATVLVIGWWWWSLRTGSARLDDQIRQAETETQQLRSVLGEVQKFETRKAQLQQRVTLIEQLRKGQATPVHVLDQISRNLPDRLWLVSMVQAGQDLTIAGQTTSLTALSDFVQNLENSGWFKRPIEILDSQVDQNPQVGDLVRFTIKTSVNAPEAAAPPAGPAGRGAPGGRGAAAAR
jgi:type IV pilus assembly protein PilN